MKYANIYADDFIAAVQGSATTRRNAMRTLLHVLDSVFRPLSPSDNPNRQEPASVKKLRKGDGNWSTRKTVLGWVIDTVAQTITLPERRLDRLNAILATFPQPRGESASKCGTSSWVNYAPWSLASPAREACLVPFNMPSEPNRKSD